MQPHRNFQSVQPEEREKDAAITCSCRNSPSPGALRNTFAECLACMTWRSTRSSSSLIAPAAAASSAACCAALRSCRRRWSLLPPCRGRAPAPPLLPCGRLPSSSRCSRALPTGTAATASAVNARCGSPRREEARPRARPATPASAAASSTGQPKRGFRRAILQVGCRRRLRGRRARPSGLSIKNDSWAPSNAQVSALAPLSSRLGNKWPLARSGRGLSRTQPHAPH